MSDNNRVIISRIQHRRGRRENLPQPLRPGELALTSDTGQVWIGNEDVAPFGIRLFDPNLPSVEDNVEDLLENNILSIQFDVPLNQEDFQTLRGLFAENAIFGAAASTPYNEVLQMLWDGNRTVFYGLRDLEITEAEAFQADDFEDFVDAIVAGFIAGTTTSGVSSATVEFAENKFDLFGGWQGTDLRILFFEDPLSILNSRSAGAVARIANLIFTNSSTPTALISTLSNIELSTSVSAALSNFQDLFEVVDVVNDSGAYTWSPAPGSFSANSPNDNLFFVAGPGINLHVDPSTNAIRISGSAVAASSDILFNTFVNQETLDGGTAGATSISFDLTESTVFMLEYSLKGTGYIAAGTLTVVVDGTSTNVMDDSLAIGLSGSVSFGAVSDGNDVTIIYNNTLTPSTDVELKVVSRRWLA